MILICTCAWTIIAKTTKTLSTPQKRSELDVSAKMNGNEKAACQQLTKNLINIVFAKCQLMNLSLPANGKTNPAKIVRKEKSVLLLRQRLTAGAGGKWGKKFGKEALINRCVIGSGGGAGRGAKFAYQLVTPRPAVSWHRNKYSAAAR